MKENYASRRAAEAVADARDMSAADFATPQDRRTRRCAWGGESEGWKGGGRGGGGCKAREVAAETRAQFGAYMQEFIEVDRARAVEVSHAEHTLQLQHVVPLARLLGK
jgi:hypothetical protein